MISSKSKSVQRLPLAGIRVLDLSQVLAGPYCTMLLAGLGAEVIKVEAPEGDLSRSMGPPYVQGCGTLFLYVNRNKKSLVLDLKRPEGQAAFHRLIPGADVLVHNFRPRAARRLRIDYATLAVLNRRLIYANVAAFGQSGPDADRPGLDAVFQATGGLMSLTGSVRGAAVKTAASVVDVGTGILMAFGIVAALLKRRQRGNGARVSGSLLDTALALQGPLFTYSSVIGRDPERVGNGSYFTVTNCFPTADGQLVISLPTGRFWRRLCGALDAPALEKDPRFGDNRNRVRHKHLLDRSLRKIFLERTTAEWLDILRAHEVPCGPVLSYSEVVRDPQVRHNRLFKWDRYSKSRPYRVVRSPLRLNGELMDGELPAPVLGQHTDHVLRTAKFTDREIRELKRQGVTVAHPPQVDRL